MAEALLPTLTVVGGPFDGAKIAVEGRTEKVLGSGPSSHLKLELENIDAMHALLSIDERGLVLSDMGSSTGCFVNGERVESDAILADGDRVSLGPPGSSQSVKLVVSIGDLATAAETPVFEEEEAEGTEVSALGASGPTLMVMGGDLDGTTFAIDGSHELLLGSGSGCNGRLAAENVAAQHVRVTWQSGGIVITDLDSARGTFVNGEKVAGSRALMDGDRICLGPPGSMQSVKLLATIPLGVVTPFEAPAPAFASPTSEVVELEPMPERTSDFHFGAAPAPAAPPPPAPAAPPAFGDGDAIVLDVSDVNAPAAPAAAVPFDFSSPAPSVAPTVPEPFLPAGPVPPIMPFAPVAPAPPPPLPATPAPQPKVVESIPLKPLELIQPPAPPRREAPAGRGAEAPRPAPRSAAVGVPRARARRSSRVPRLVWVAAAAAALGGGGFVLYARFHASPPVLSAIQPTKAEPGQAISIAGTDFAGSVEGNVVRFNNQPGQVTSAAPDRLSVTVPEIPLGNASVTVEARGARSNALFLKVAPVPRVKSVEPEVALPGQTVVIKGSRLSGGTVSVSVAGIRAELLESGPEQLTIRIPVLTFQEGSPALLRVQVGEEPAAPGKLILGRLPLVGEVSPTQAAAGDRVTIKGRGFAAAAKDNHVRFGDRPALVVEAQPTQLVVSAPSSASPYGQVDAPMVVEVGGSESRSVGFSLLRQSGGLFVPRFFAAPVVGHSEHDHALVSTELGPFLALSDKAEAVSTAARAVAVADALNKLFERAAQGAVTVEVRESPRLSILASGDPAPLCVVTAADAAGLGEPWAAAGGRSQSISARDLARFWAAIVDDFLMLFVRHDRPTRLVELSPRAKVLLDLFSAAQRRSGAGGGVQTAAVLPLNAATAEGFRNLALMIPSGGAPGRSTIAIEGQWQGSLTESERPRGFQIELRSAGGQLIGSCTIKEGKLPVAVTLGDVGFAGGQLRFSLAIRGSVLFFKGKLQGTEIQGTIHKRADDAAPVGQFQLKYVQ